MDNRFAENDFVKDHVLYARESKPSSEKIPKDTDNKSRIDESLIKKTRSVWEPLYGREITNDEAIDIIEKFSNIFEVMAECGKKEDPSPLNHNGENGYA